MARVVHVMRGHLAVTTELQGGLIVCRDTLTCGPSDIDPRKHRLGRTRFWRRIHGGKGRPMDHDIINSRDLTRRLRAARTRGGTICLWINADDWSDFVFMCWAADALQDHSGDGVTIRVILFSKEQLDSVFTSKQVADAISEAVIVSEGFLLPLARLWRAFAAGTPGEVMAMAKSVSLEGAKQFIESYAMVFGRIRNGSIQLSEYDRCLLGCLLRQTWRKPSDILEALLGKPNYVPPEYSRRRLEDWSAHAGGTFVIESGEDVDSVSPWAAVAYRLTDRGELLVREGSPSGLDAPAMWIGGTNVYQEWLYDETEKRFVPRGGKRT